jgi:hypothetical protein
VVVVFIGFVLSQRVNVEQATRPSAKDESRQKTGELRRTRKNPLERSYDLEVKSERTAIPRFIAEGMLDFTAATSVARGQ